MKTELSIRSENQDEPRIDGDFSLVERLAMKGIHEDMMIFAFGDRWLQLPIPKRIELLYRFRDVKSNRLIEPDHVSFVIGG